MEKKELKVDVPKDVASGTYSNLAIISHTRTEFILDFASIMPGADKPEIRSRIIMSPEHVKRLLAAIQDNIGKYESKFGQIVMGGEPKATFDMGSFGGSDSGLIS